MSIGGFAEAVAVLLALYPGSVTSWFRSTQRNKMVGGGPGSWHLAGLAADIVLDNPQTTDRPATKQIRDKCVDRARRLGLDAVDEGDHIHVEVSG